MNGGKGARERRLARRASYKFALDNPSTYYVRRGTDGDVSVKDGRGAIVASGFDNQAEAEQWIADQQRGL